jgi:guanylate kinase
MIRKRIAGTALAGLLAVLLLMQCMSAIAEADTRWADASDEIDKFLDTAFEDYLAGNADAAYQNVSNAYFRVYETTGFERQTMSYISGNRKNAVEMQFSNCKAAVKKDNTEQDTRVSVRTALVKLKDMIREDAFVEYDEHAQNYYGTPVAQLEEKMKTGHVILDIEPVGAKIVRGKRPDAVLIFIMPPSREELERRLRSRGDTSAEQIQIRLERANWEMDQSNWYDHVVVNDQVETCANKILDIIAKKADEE